MKALTFFAFVTVILTAAIAGPLGEVHSHSNHGVLERRNNREIIISGSISLDDWLTDLIEAITGSDVGKLLNKIDLAVTKLEKILLDAETKLHDIKHLVSEEGQTEIQAILDEELAQAKELLDPLLAQFKRLMPAISGLSPNDISSIIIALLGKTLEQFLHDVGHTLHAINELLVRIKTRLQVIAETVGQAAADKIRELIDQTLKEGEATIKPLLDVLNQIFDFDIDNPKIINAASPSKSIPRRIRHYRHRQVQNSVAGHKVFH